MCPWSGRRGSRPQVANADRVHLQADHGSLKLVTESRVRRPDSREVRLLDAGARSRLVHAPELSRVGAGRVRVPLGPRGLQLRRGCALHEPVVRRPGAVMLGAVLLVAVGTLFASAARGAPVIALAPASRSWGSRPPRADGASPRRSSGRGEATSPSGRRRAAGSRPTWPRSGADGRSPNRGSCAEARRRVEGAASCSTAAYGLPASAQDSPERQFFDVLLRDGRCSAQVPLPAKVGSGGQTGRGLT